MAHTLLLLCVALAGPFTTDWRSDPIWYDGKAEIATYDASRDIYGQSRTYTARFMTNKERLSPQTFTKDANSQGPEVFKFHVREAIPTEAYTYHYSTMVYVDADDLTSLKLDMGSQEDCGASMKRCENRQGQVVWSQYSYFPEQGHRTMRYEAPDDFVLADALPLVLRAYPFHNPQPMTLSVVPDQTSTRWSPVEPVPAEVSWRGTETLQLPAGEMQAHQLAVRLPDGEHRYWFSADPRTQHVLAQYEGPGGQSYRLREVVRDAYWE